MPCEPINQLPDSLIRQLNEFKRRLRVIKIVEALCLAGIVLTLTFLILFTSDRLWDTPHPFVSVLSILGICGLFIFLPWWGIQWVWRRRKATQLAKLIGDNDADLGDRLLGIIELNAEETNNQFSSEALKQAAIKQIAEEVAKKDLNINIPKPKHLHLSWALGLLFFIIVIISCWSPDAADNTFHRFISPTNPPPRFTFTQLSSTPEEIIVPLGESSGYTLKLSEHTQTKPEQASYHLSNEILYKATLFNNTYELHIPPLQLEDELTITAGDYIKTIRIVPKQRPTLRSVAARVHYPDYLGLTDESIGMKAGIISAPNGATLHMTAEASQALASAKLIQGDALSVDNEFVTLPPQKLTNQSQNLQLQWTDLDGLSSGSPIQIKVEAIEDQNPSVYIRAKNDELYILEESSIELEVEAADDYGLKNIGIEWVNEQSDKSDESSSGTEKLISQGNQTTKELSGKYVFQARALQIKPQSLLIRAYTQDYHPDHKRIYSEPLSITILSPSEHAQKIKSELERITGDLESIIRHMEAMSDEAKRLKDIPADQLKSEESRQRLQSLADEEEILRGNMQELMKESEELFKEASKNSQIDPKGMKEFMKGLGMMKPIAPGKMLQAQKKFQEAADNNQSPSQSQDALKEGEKKHDEAIQQMKKAMNQLNKSTQEMEASTFVARLRQSATKEETIANSLVNKLTEIVGFAYDDLDPSNKRELNAIAQKQHDSTQDIAWILEDLNYYKARSSESIYSELYEKMDNFSLREKLDATQNNIKQAITAQSIDEAHYYASTLRAWAKLIDDFKKQKDASSSSGGGGDGGGDQESMSDQEFEFMLKVIRMIQKEQAIRSKTRAIEQERRNALPSEKK